MVRWIRTGAASTRKCYAGGNFSDIDQDERRRSTSCRSRTPTTGVLSTSASRRINVVSWFDLGSFKLKLFPAASSNRSRHPGDSNATSCNRFFGVAVSIHVYRTMISSSTSRYDIWKKSRRRCRRTLTVQGVLLLILALSMLSAPSNFVGTILVSKTADHHISLDATHSGGWKPITHAAQDHSFDNHLPKFKLGAFRNEHAWPYISADGWYDLANNTRQVVLATTWPDVDWLAFLNLQTSPVIVIMINNLDIPFPPERKAHQHQLNQSALEHVMLKRLYVYNPSIEHPKVFPLPVGPKWQTRSLSLFGESKAAMRERLVSVARSGEDSRRLFMDGSRTNTVWVRPSSLYRWRTFDIKLNRALQTPRSEVCRVLSASAPNSTVCGTGNDNANSNSSFLSPEMYWQELQRHRFVASPPGHGMDSHATWEALMAGCIPIVPRSALDKMFADFPVWLVHSWQDEVTDMAVQTKALEIRAKVDNYNWDKIYATGWAKEIQDAFGQ